MVVKKFQIGSYSRNDVTNYVNILQNYTKSLTFRKW